MRLTLRTLLAYLDDTLDPAATKTIGEKVAESELAQELIDKIKKVTRRRGLKAPSIAGSDDDPTTDPNTVAEFLDNSLQGDQLTEVETAALASDAYLAEIAACHQILTLVLGEPAKVPPTAHQRMYRLVKGRESIPYRKPAISRGVTGMAPPAEEDDDADDTLLGLTDTRGYVPYIGAAVVLLLLVVVVFFTIPSPSPAAPRRLVSVAALSPETARKAPEVVASKELSKDVGGGSITAGSPKKPGEAVKKEVPIIKKEAVVENKLEVLPAPREVKESEVKVTAVPEKKALVEPAGKPDPERKVIGKTRPADLLLFRQSGAGEWNRLPASKDVNSTDTLLSLPGIPAEVDLRSGIELTLWGSLPFFEPVPFLTVLECRLTLHVPPPGFEADFTLEGGRVFIKKAHTAPPGPAHVRVRFRNEVWDITLTSAETEVCLDLTSHYSEGVPFARDGAGESPMSEFTFGLIKGECGVRVRFREYPSLQALTKMDWNNKEGKVRGPDKLPEDSRAYWDRAPALTDAKDKEMLGEFKQAAAVVAKDLSDPDRIMSVTLASAAKERPQREVTSRDVFKLEMALFCLQAVDKISELADALEDEIQGVRFKAIIPLIHWTGQSRERDQILYKLLQEKKHFTESEAMTVMQLLHPFSAERRKAPETVQTLFDFLKSDRLAVRQMALGQLYRLDPDGVREFLNLDVGAPPEVRDPIIQRWRTSWKSRWEKKK